MNARRWGTPLRPTGILGSVASHRARRCAATAASTLALVAILGTSERASFAQQPPPGDSVTAIARERYAEGVKAYDAGRFEDARAAFLQTYALKRHPAVLLNLGQAELRSHHEDDAGNHLQQFLREHATATPDQRAAAEKGIAEAKHTTGTVIVNVDSPGADVSIDGNTVGKTPLVDPVFVKPGKHTVFAAFQGKTGAATIEVKVGVATPANLTLGAGPAVPPPAPPVEPPPAPPVAPPAQPVPVFVPPPANPMPPIMQPLPPDDGGPPRYTFGEWYRHKPLAWVGTGLAAVGLGMGIGGGIAALNASTATSNDTAQIVAHNMASPQDNPTHRTNLCGDANGNNPVPAYAQPCSVLSGDISSYHTGVAVMATGWVFFGVGAVGTVVYAMVDWYPHRATASAPKQTGPQIAVTPIVTRAFQGVGALGTF
jgi:hypothetical protein